MNAVNIAKNLGVEYNVSIRVLDQVSGQVISEHVGHNAATNSMMLGIAQYITGQASQHQGYGQVITPTGVYQPQVTSYIPKFISLGTMGLTNQEEDEQGLPTGIGAPPSDYLDDVMGGVNGLSFADALKQYEKDTDEVTRFVDYVVQEPGYGACGYDATLNNDRRYFGLGPLFENREGGDVQGTVMCELVSPSFPRAPISFRQIIPESEAEQSECIDVVFSALISTGALAQFREPGKDYVFITEVGLWSKADWDDSGDNGLLAGYRIVPPDHNQWKMGEFDEASQTYSDSDECRANRDALRRQIIRVGKNQVVQVIWKVSLGSLRTLAGIEDYMKLKEKPLQWIIWN